MRKWMDVAAPDDPNAWFDLSDMWGTGRGSYETSDAFGSATATTAAGEQAIQAAWAFKGLSSDRAYLIGTKIWQITPSTMAATDRTGGITIGTGLMMCQYGDITILARGTSNSLASSSGGNFSALAGSPSAKFVCTAANAVLAFNTSVSADGWAASDVGDYTNWSTGEAASGRILENNGPITAVVPLGNDVYVFKSDSIFRMTYVGGTVKWQIQKVVHGVGCFDPNSGAWGGSPAVATNRGIVFHGNANFSGSYSWWLYDGASPPVLLNPATTVTAGVPTYDPIFDRLVIWYPYQVSTFVFRTKVYTYSFSDGLWGKCSEIAETVDIHAPVPVRGDQSVSFAGSTTGSLRTVFEGDGSGGSIYYRVPVAPTSSASCYLQTTKIGASDHKTTFSRLIPQLRKRTDLGTDSASLELTLFREREDTTAQTTRTISESSGRKRFDLHGGANTDNFARFKVTWAGLDVDVDDFQVVAKPAGTD